MVKRITLSKRMKDITGYRRGKLVALYPVDDGKKRAWATVMWLCQCDCGERSVATSGGIVWNPKIISCGCHKSDRMMGMNEKKVVHNMTGSPEYLIWQGMKDRCYREENISFCDYGARGIGVHPAWVDNFSAFFAYIGPRPSPEHSIDRYPNNDGDYEPGNIRWATKHQQDRNKRNNIMVNVFGRTERLAEIVPWPCTGAIYKRARYRIKHGWDHELTVVAALLGR